MSRCSEAPVKLRSGSGSCSHLLGAAFQVIRSGVSRRSEAPVKLRSKGGSCSHRHGPALQGRRSDVIGTSVPARRRLLAAASALLLGGCGFELRRAPELGFRTIALTGFAPNSPLAEELRKTINASTDTRVVEPAEQPQVVLEVIEDVREKSVVASTAVGQVTEFQLRARLRFRLRGASGKLLIPATEIVLSRDMSYTESAALGKEQEEAFLYRSMQNDIVAQVLRRLASVQNF